MFFGHGFFATDEHGFSRMKRRVCVGLCEAARGTEEG